MRLSKKDVAARLREAGAMLVLRGENLFRARAYERGADALEEDDQELETLVEEGRLTEVPGIGPSLANTISELVRTGRARALDVVMDGLPAGLLALASLPGLTPRRILRLHDELGISNLEDLRRAIEAGAVESLHGFGPVTVARVREALVHARTAPPLRSKPRLTTYLLADAWPLARRLLAHLRLSPGVEASEIAGQVRRASETVDCIHLVVASLNPQLIWRSIQGHPAVAAAKSQQNLDGHFRLNNGMPAILTIVRPEHFAVALLRATGSPSHVAQVTALAGSQGVDLDSLHEVSESALYARLALPFFPPELREDIADWHAVQAGGTFTDLITVGDIRGLVHCHTTHSDGRATVLDMARAAHAMGMSYLTITDHSPRASYAHGVLPERLPEQWAEIRAAQREMDAHGFTLLRGTESDILSDGRLDYDVELLKSLDIVIASIHERHKMDDAAMTERLVRALAQPLFKVWGHPLGRLLLKRDPIACDVARILDVAAQTATAVEINGSPHRLDLPASWIRAARTRGLKFVISVDAHSTSELDYLSYGVSQARRAGVRRQEVLNTLPAPEFLKAVRPALQ